MSFDHELVLPNEDLPFRLFLFEGKNGNYIREKHWHRSVEIFAVQEGSLTFCIDDREYPLGPGDFMLVSPNEIHSVKAPEKNRTIVLQIPFPLLEPYCGRDGLLLFTHTPGQHDRKLIRLVQRIYIIYEQKQRGYELEVRGLFYHLLHLLISRYQTSHITGEDIRRNKNLNHLSPITAYLKEHYASDLSLKLVAETFGYTPAYLSRMFRLYAGIRYHDYLEEIRLRYACKDMDLGEGSLNQIALRHGFANSKALARAFQKKFQILPSEYLRKKDK